jgi:hypothetical protein
VGTMQEICRGCSSVKNAVAKGVLLWQMELCNGSTKRRGMDLLSLKMARKTPLFILAPSNNQALLL